MKGFDFVRDGLIGMKFGRLTVVSEGERTPNKKRTWICQCDCGNVKRKSVAAYDLKIGKVKSCGCLRLEGNKGINKTHGKTGTRLHFIWLGMKQRCKCISGVSFQNYGGRGIKVCDEWLHDFQAFYDWAMSHGYSDNLTIDRIDVNGNYCPENCRWVTMKEQQNNRRNNRTVQYGGESYSLSKLADKLGIPAPTLAYRINHGWKESEYTLSPNLNNKNIRSGNI